MNNLRIINYNDLTSEEKKVLTEESISRITDLTNNIKASFVELGYHLKRIKESKGFIELGYKTLDEFTEDKFNLKSTSVKNMISIFDKFGEVNDGIPMISAEFDKYNYAQLTELVPVVNSVKPEEQEEKKKQILDEFSTDLSAKQIREKRNSKKTVKPEKKPEVKSEVKTVSTNSSQPTDYNNYNSSSNFENVIKNYLDNFAKEDNSFNVKYSNPKKNIKECCNFIISEVYKRKVNALTSEEVFGLALHYYDEEEVSIQNVNANVVCTEGI